MTRGEAPGGGGSSTPRRAACFIEKTILLGSMSRSLAFLHDRALTPTGSSRRLGDASRLACFLAAWLPPAIIKRAIEPAIVIATEFRSSSAH